MNMQSHCRQDNTLNEAKQPTSEARFACTPIMEESTTHDPHSEPQNLNTMIAHGPPT